MRTEEGWAKKVSGEMLKPDIGRECCEENGEKYFPRVDLDSGDAFTLALINL